MIKASNNNRSTMELLVGFVCAVMFCVKVKLIKADDIEFGPKFVMCDFDLDLQLATKPENIKYLPDECQNLSDEEKELLMEEAENFKLFHEKLLSYEKGLGMDTEEFSYKDWDFRDELYTNVSLHLCSNSTETLQDYVGCVMEKRDEMITLIDERNASNNAD